MIKVERGPKPPESLRARAARLEALAVACFYRAKRRNQPPPTKKRTFTAYKGNDVIVALNADFHNKCAYCEDSVAKGARDVEHYRPKGKVDGAVGHDGYWWLAYSWTNLLPSCPACNQGLLQHIVTEDMDIKDVEAMQSRLATEKWGKLNRFNVQGPRAMRRKDDLDAEDPLLIDPTRSDPEPHLQWLWKSPYSIVVARTEAGAKSAYGEETVKCCALNRLDLVKARTAELNTLKVMREKLLEYLAAATDDPGRRAQHVAMAEMIVDIMKLHGVPERRFAGMARAFLRDVEQELRDWKTKLQIGAGGAAPAPAPPAP